MHKISKNKFLSYTFILISLVSILSCAARRVRDEGDIIASLYKEKKYQTVIDRITKKEVYERQEDRFLKQAELGIAYFNLKDYKKALFHLNKAKEIANSLYKVSISNKVESLFIGEATDIYYPNQFEQISIRFYEILSHYMLIQSSESSKDKRFHQQAMVSTLRDWSSYIDNFKEQNRGRAIYKGSTFIDLMGVIVHDVYDRSKDRSVIKSFKKLGQKNLVEQMGIYPSYNELHEKYKDDYNELHLLSQKKLANYISETQTSNNIKKFFQNKKRYNTYIIILDGHVIKKTANVYEFPLGLPVGVYIYNDEGMDDFVTFSLKMLSITRGTEPKISFELPKIDSVPITNTEKVTLTNADGNEVLSDNLILMANTSEVLSESLKTDVKTLEAKVGARLAAKHIALLTSAYQTYRSLYNNGAFIAYLSASAAYAAGNKAIAESELADLRSWYGIYDHVYMLPVDLKPGEYEITYKGKKYKLTRSDSPKQILPLVLN
ncbi:hypothetical protein [Halobacteriovorax sp.]|uniref:hypothetical protein n=1 Tax=Halobacteriovorax sp. TaxID=2020862 RepID=UPI003AF22E64